MGRFSPTVREEAFDLGGVLDRLAGGYLDVRYEKEEHRRIKRQERLEDEDRNRYFRGLEAADRAQPGAITATEAADRDLYTATSLSAIGDAGVKGLPFAFKGYEPQSLADMIPNYAGGATPQTPEPIAGQEPGAERKPGEDMFRDATPYVTEAGVIIDPRRAREQKIQETMLGGHLDRYLAGPPETVEERAVRIEADERAKVSGRRPTDEQHDVDVERARALAGARRAPEKPDEIEPPKSIGMLERQIDDARSDLNRLWRMKPDTPYPESDAVVRGAYDAWRRQWDAAEARADSLGTVRDRLVGGFMEEEGTAPRDPDYLEFTDEPEQGNYPFVGPPTPPAESTDLTLAQRQDMAANEWEELVDAGTDMDEATRLIREKYGLSGGQ